MFKFLIYIFLMFPFVSMGNNDYKVKLHEFDLDNGLHVILHQDKSSPVVIVGTKYHVGSKNEEADRTGFAHFFEHLLFHGSENIPQGEFENIIMTAGGYCNAYTSYDVTYYYNILPAHEYKLGIWAESERMLHPVITEKGINTEREIVKEEKRMRYSSSPLGNSYNDMMEALYDVKTYGHSMIGSMEHLNASTLNDFDGFFNKFYVPNNACLVLAGNIDYDDAKKWVKHYFEDIPKGKPIKRPTKFELSSRKPKVIEKQIPGLKKHAVAISYYGIPETENDAFVLEMISGLLAKNNSYSYFDKNVVKNDSTINGISTTAELWEGVGFLNIKVRMEDDNTDVAIEKVQNEINKLKDNFNDENNLERMKNNYEASYIDYYFDSEMLADMVTNYHHIFGSGMKFNDLIDTYKNISTEDIMRVAKKYLKPEKRTVIIYIPEDKEVSQN